MHTGVYLQKNSKGLIPAELWELVLKNNTSGLGVVAATMDKTAVQIQSGVGKPQLVELETFQKEYLDRAVLFYLYEATDDFKVEDIQPYIILNDNKENPLLAVLLNGAFERHVENNGHTPEFNAAFEYLQDRMEGLYAIARGDLAKMLDLMRAKNFRKEVLNVIGEGNSITMMAANGEIVSYGPVEEVVKYPWGWSTNYYGFGEKKIEAAPPKEEAKPTGMAKLFGKKEKVNNPPTQTLQTVAVVPDALAQVDKGPGVQDAATAIHNQAVVADANKEIWVIPTKKIQWSNNKKSQWYHRIQPSIARDAWKATPPVKTNLGELTVLKMTDYDIVDAPKGLDKLQEYRAMESQKQKEEKPKDTETHNVPQPTPATPENQVAKSNASLVSVIPRVPSDEQKKIVAIIQGSKGTIDPEAFKTMERNHPTILDISGLKHWDQLHKLDYNDIYEIAANRAAAAVMIMNLIGQHIRLSEKEKAVTEAAQRKIAM